MAKQKKVETLDDAREVYAKAEPRINLVKIAKKLKNVPEVSGKLVVPQLYLNLICDSRTEVTRERDPNDSWSSDDKSTSWYVNGIELSEKDGYHALPADFPVQPGDLVFALYAVYSDGDSFHHHEGAYLEVLSFHKDEAVAQRNYQHINSRSTIRGNSFEMELELDNGKKIKRRCPWDGYFERLDYVSLERFLVGVSYKRYN